MFSILLCAASARIVGETNLGWGWEGHQMTARVAQYFVTDKVLDAMELILHTTNLSSVATWADHIKYVDAYEWSGGLHFINVPEGKCSFDYTTDCVDPKYGKDHCVAGAIHNYTQRSLMKNISDEQRDEAVKFLIHFVGDIHQPLHCGWDKDEGGNTIQITYMQDEWNLHAVWDEGIIDTRLTANYTDWDSYAEALIQRMEKNGEITDNPVSTWLDCDATDRGQPCTDIWAQESIGFSCTNAYFTNTHQRIKSGMHLAEAYFENNIDVIELRLAQGGFRLAHLLNIMFDPEHCSDPAGGPSIGIDLLRGMPSPSRPGRVRKASKKLMDLACKGKK